MKNPVRWFMVFVSVCLMMAAVSSAAAESVNWDKPSAKIVSEGNTVAVRGTVLTPDVFSKVLNVHDQVGGWFILTIPEGTDSLTFSVLCPALKHGKFAMRFYRALDFENDQWEEFLWLVFPADSHVQTGVLTGIKEGDIIAWWDDDMGGKAWTNRTDFRMMITPNVTAVDRTRR